MNVLFDLDGTLTDPGDGFARCVAHALSTLQCLDHSESDIRRHVGPPLQDTLKNLLGTNSDQLDAAIVLYRERYARIGYLENVLYPGVRELLETLKGRGLALFVATSKPVVFSRRILEHFGLASYFRGIYGSEFDGRLSDKGELIAHLLRAESLPSARTFMIGDRAQDVLGAISNGVQPIGALWGYGTREELEAAGAQVLCQQPEEALIALLLAAAAD